MRILPVTNYNYQNKTQNNKQQNVNFSQNGVDLAGLFLNSKTKAIKQLPKRLADGCETARAICSRLYFEAPLYDNRANRGLATLFTLDEEHIYGYDIRVLYKDICGESIERMVKVLRAQEAGIIKPKALYNDIERAKKIAQGEKVETAAEVNIADVVKKVNELTQQGKLGAGVFYYDYEQGRQLIR